MSALFIGTCVELSKRHIEHYDDTARVVTYKTFARHVGTEIVAALNQEYHHPKIKDDFGVSFSKGKWRGKPCVVMHHSGIHHFYLLQ